MDLRIKWIFNTPSLTQQNGNARTVVDHPQKPGETGSDRHKPAIAKFNNKGIDLLAGITRNNDLRDAVPIDV